MGIFRNKGKGKLKQLIGNVKDKISGFEEKHPLLAGLAGAAISKLPGGGLLKNAGKLGGFINKIGGKIGAKVFGGKFGDIVAAVRRDGKINVDKVIMNLKQQMGSGYTEDHGRAMVEELHMETGAELQQTTMPESEGLLKGLFDGIGGAARGNDGIFKKSPWKKFKNWVGTTTGKIVMFVVAPVVLIIILGATVFKGKKGKMKGKFFGKFRG